MPITALNGLFSSTFQSTPNNALSAQQQQPFWGGPYGWTPDALFRFDSNGDVDPNWALPASAMNPWDTAHIQGAQVPGLVRFEVKKAQRRQKRTSPGDDRANVTMLGWDLAEVVMTTKLWTEQQFFDWQVIVLRLEQQILGAKTSQQAGTTQYAGGYAAVKIEHPGLAMHNIAALYVVELGPPAPTGDPGIFQAKIIFEEFNPAKQGSTQTIKGAPSANIIPSQYADKSGSQKSGTVAPPSQGAGVSSPLSGFME